MYQAYTTNLRNVLGEIDATDWDNAINLIKDAYSEDRKVLTCGNGGSASTSSHFITDWNKMTQHHNGKALKGICLADNIGLITAYANDYSYVSIYSEQVKFYGKKDDLLIIVSGSGNSPNVVAAIDTANSLGMKTLSQEHL